MPTIYRIKHIPSGLYFCPSRSIKVKLDGEIGIYQKMGRYIKSNLSPTGKTYVRRPSITQIGRHYYTHHGVASVLDLDHDIVGDCKMLEVVAQEWMIEEIN
jgi:hypothetical protein